MCLNFKAIRFFNATDIIIIKNILSIDNQLKGHNLPKIYSRTIFFPYFLPLVKNHLYLMQYFLVFRQFVAN